MVIKKAYMTNESIKEQLEESRDGSRRIIGDTGYFGWYRCFYCNAPSSIQNIQKKKC